MDGATAEGVRECTSQPSAMHALGIEGVTRRRCGAQSVESADRWLGGGVPDVGRAGGRRPEDGDLDPRLIRIEVDVSFGEACSITRGARDKALATTNLVGRDSGQQSGQMLAI